MSHLQHSQPIAIYNANEPDQTKKLIGVFATQMLVVRYLYTINLTEVCKQLGKKIARKERLTDTRMGYPVAIRYASAEKAALLEGDWFISAGYDEPAGLGGNFWCPLPK